MGQGGVTGYVSNDPTRPYADVPLCNESGPYAGVNCSIIQSVQPRLRSTRNSFEWKLKLKEFSGDPLESTRDGIRHGLPSLLA